MSVSDPSLRVFLRMCLLVLCCVVHPICGLRSFRQSNLRGVPSSIFRDACHVARQTSSIRQSHRIGSSHHLPSLSTTGFNRELFHRPLFKSRVGSQVGDRCSEADHTAINHGGLLKLRTKGAGPHERAHIRAYSSAEPLIKPPHRPFRQAGRGSEHEGKPKGTNQLIQEANSAEESLDVMEIMNERLSPINVVTCLHTIAKKHPEFLQTTHTYRVQRQWNLLMDNLETVSLNLDSRGIASTIWAFGKLNVASSILSKDQKGGLKYAGTIQVTPELLEDFMDLATAQVHNANPQSLSNILWGMVQLELKAGYKDELLAKIEHYSVLRRNETDAHSLSNILWCFASLRYPVKPSSLKLLEERGVVSIRSFNAQDLSNSLWAFAQLEHRPSSMFNVQLQNAALDKVQSFEPQGIANILWSLAKLKLRPEPRLLEALDRASVKLVGRFNPQAVSNILWSFGTIRHRPSVKLLKALQLRSIALSNECTSQGIANILWALTQLEEKPMEVLVEDLENNIMRKSHMYSAQAISMVLWSFATLELKLSQRLSKVISNRIVATAPDFTPQSISNTLWALSKFRRHPEGRVLRALKEEIAIKHAQLNMQGAVNILWAFSRFAQHPIGRVVKAVTHSIVRRHFNRSGELQAEDAVVESMRESYILDEYVTNSLHEKALDYRSSWTPQSISSLLWSLAKTPFPELTNPDMIRTLEEGAITHSKAMSWQHLSIILWSFAKLLHKPGPQFYESFDMALQQVARHAEKEEYITMMWALGILEWPGATKD